jgi:threonine/homoserine/homoserine lactone efflux protein
MTEPIGQIVFYGLAAALAVPIVAVVTALILGKSGWPIALTFTAGAATFDILVALLFLWALGETFDSAGDASAYVDVGLGVIFGALGIKAIFSADSPDADAARRGRAQQIAGAKLLALFGAGLAVQVINADALAVFLDGIKQVAKANVSSGQGTVAILICLVWSTKPLANAVKTSVAHTEWFEREESQGRPGRGSGRDGRWRTCSLRCSPCSVST